MYTNAGMLEAISTRDIALNLEKVRKILDAVEAEKVQVSEKEFDELVRWEEDIKAHFVHKAEVLGMTNVANQGMSLP